MANKPLIILHGWSDNSTSFHKLAKLIETQTARAVQEINLADYLSKDDAISFYDLAAAMQRAWLISQQSLTPGSVDVLAHSAGALVVRTWLHLYYPSGHSPIKNLVLLAPANFGSPLAHKGRAFFGRVLKGFNSSRPFQVGAQLLKELELASPFTFNLALADRFNSTSYYGNGQILCTVLCGNTGFSGIAAAANEKGGDGTVRVAGANLNCGLLEVDFYQDPHHPRVSLQSSSGQTAFGILDGETHHTIIDGAGGFNNPATMDFILQALQVQDHEFTEWCQKLQYHNQLLMNANLADCNKHGFQNTLCMVSNQFEQPVNEYFIEFFGTEHELERVAEMFHTRVIESVHPYSDNPSFRSIYLDCTELLQVFAASEGALLMSLSAYPEIVQQGDVGYRTFTDDDIGCIEIKRTELLNIFNENRTLLVKIKLKREQSANIFNIHPLP